MLNERRKAAQGVADRLMAAEAALDLALTCAAELTGYMPAARIEANIAAEIGHSAMEHSAAALSLMMRARGEIVAAHRELAITKDQIGLRTVAIGGLVPKPPLQTTGQLSLVETAAA